MHIRQLEAALQQHNALDLTRERRVLEQRDVIAGKKIIHFCSNDYLGMASHPDVKKAFVNAANQYGLGSGSSNLISGYYKPHYLLEEAFAEFFNREKALLFNSGYHANLGVLTAFAKRHSWIIADKLCHASLIDGIVLSRANYARFKHNQVNHAKTLLKKHHDQSKLLVTESIFSMEGSISPLTELATLAKHHSAMMIVDDAHGVGVLGKTGGGICEHLQLSAEDVPCLISPLGKAFGSMGAIVSGPAALIETLLQFAKTYCYTTALPPAISAGTLAALTIIKTDTWRREKLKYLAEFFMREALKRQLPLLSTDNTPIQSILIGSNKNALLLQQHLLNHGFFIACIRPPTVPKNTARIKITLNCLHTEKHILELLDRVNDYRLKLPHE